MSAGERIGPQPGLYPSPSFGDGVWERILVVLWKSGTKRDLDIARRLDRDLQETRRLNIERVARRSGNLDALTSGGSDG